MQDQTIIIHNYNIFSLKTTRIVLGVLGIAFILLAFSEIITRGELTAPTNLFWGVFLIITSTLVLSEKSSISPKVQFTDTFVLLKSGLWSRSKKLDWSTIKKVELGSYKITFHEAKDNFVFKYNSDLTVSKKIKEVLRQSANEKGIPVIGG